MAQKSGFFKARLNGGVYDRTYTADDYCDNLAVIISSGVLRSANDDLKVTASGLNLSVNSGRGWIKGRYYHNETVYSLPAVSPPTGGTRIDRVVLRLNKSVGVRAIAVQYLTGTAATSPVAPAITRNDTIYDLVLAEVTVTANASTVSVVDKRGDSDLCGWVYSTAGDNSFFVSLDNEFDDWFDEKKDTLSSVTLFKRYSWQTTLNSASTEVTFNIPQYDADTCFIELYVNGIYTTDYSQSGSVLTFDLLLLAGTEVLVYAYKSIDGTGITSISDEITDLQNEVATIIGANKFCYTATGSDDNISLSQIAQAIYAKDYDPEDVTAAAAAFLNKIGGSEYLQALGDGAQITVSVVGLLGVTTPVSGLGTTVSPYHYFDFGISSHTDLRLMFDFSGTDTITIGCGNNTDNFVFFGTDMSVRGVSVSAGNLLSGEGCNIRMAGGSGIGSVIFDECRFFLDTTGNASIAGHGTFKNCTAVVKAYAGDAFCFDPASAQMVNVIGGRYLAYTGDSNDYTSAVFHIASNNQNAVIFGQSVNCPSVALTSPLYYQGYLAETYSGNCVLDMITSVLDSVGAEYNTIQNQIEVSKAF